MSLKVITAEQRRSAEYQKTSLAIFGPYGIGKTSLLHTLPADYTVCIDIEAGLKSIENSNVPSIPVGTFEDFQDLTALIAGPDRAAPADRWFSTNHYDHIVGKYQNTPVEQYASRPIVFVDSITKLTRKAMQYAQQRPEAFSDRTGKADIRGAYGVLAREVIASLEHLQQAPGKTIIFVGLLDKVKDDYGNFEWLPQMEGSKAGRELPGIVDQVITMQTFSEQLHQTSKEIVFDENATLRRLVCQKGNPWGFPAKDRSGRLDLTEAPDLTALLIKINQ